MVLQEPQVSIGILAYNEERRIAKTLETLFAQDVFKGENVEVVIVANGCIDQTAAVARHSLQDNQSVWSVRGSAKVEELATAGKSNAWNHFVHEFSSPSARIFVLMDADIELVNSNTISSMITTLRSDEQAVVCVDRPVKDIEVSTKRNMFQTMLAAATPGIDPDNVPLCGQLYCAFSDQLRAIELPLDIAAEDGFLRALLLTDGFRKPENRKRIVLDPTAQHIFTSVATLKELYKHEVWLVTESIVNMLLFDLFAAECTPDRSAMSLMKERQEQDPQWLKRYAELQARERGGDVLPRAWWTRRWLRLWNLPLGQRVRRFPAALAAAIMDMWIFAAAIRKVRSGRIDYWPRN